jgi:hypothetical protein
METQTKKFTEREGYTYFNFALGSRVFFFRVNDKGGQILGMKRMKIGEKNKYVTVTAEEAQHCIFIQAIPLLLEDLCLLYCFEEPDGEGWWIRNFYEDNIPGQAIMEGSLYGVLNFYHTGKTLSFN